MNAEYIQIARNIALSPSEVKTITVESGTPYRHLVMFVQCDGSHSKINAQPLFGGNNDGALIPITTLTAKKIFQVGVDEIRPATRGFKVHPSDDAVPIPIKSELKLTNAGTKSTTVSVFIIAAAAPGGS